MKGITGRTILHFTIILISCGVAFACRSQLLASGITQDEKRIILQEHNRLRQIVATGRYPGQPGAENMREIVWDDELAARAQQWANNCEFRHDPLRTINRFTMGQNLAIIWSTAPLDANDGDFPSRIQGWFNEVQKYSFGDAWSPKTGHYSQLVWGETSLVGCGFAEYKDTVKYNKLYVCNYGPGGNVVGYNPYQVGKPSCASWGMRPSPHYQGLCASPVSPFNSIATNNIETYEYKQTNNQFNNKQTSYTTKFAQPASSFPQQASSLRSKTTAISSPSTNVPSRNNAFGAKATTTSYTTETSSNNKYKNKLEAYKPTPTEFQSSVRKHTILRTYVTTLNQNGGQTSEQTEQVQPEVVVGVEEPQVETQKPAKRGWSLLTWRG